jgi:hypothetical protein
VVPPAEGAWQTTTLNTIGVRVRSTGRIRFSNPVTPEILSLIATPDSE